MRRWQATFWKRRYGFLFASLLLTLGVTPLLSAFDFPREILVLFLGLNLCAAVLGVEEIRARPAFNVALAMALALRLLAIVVDSSHVDLASQVIWAGIAFLAAASAVRFAMRSARVTRQHVYAALSAYLIAGHFCGLLYVAIDRIQPGSFQVAGAASQPLELATAIYFSFVTLTTLGYGDVVPVANAARGVVVVEAVVGQLYLAVLVARLVGLHSQSTRGPGNASPGAR